MARRGRRFVVSFDEEKEPTEAEKKAVDKKEKEVIKQTEKEFDRVPILNRDGEVVQTQVKLPAEIGKEFITEQDKKKNVYEFNPLDVTSQTVKISVPKTRERAKKDIIQQKQNSDIADLHLKQNKDLVGAGIKFKVMNL